MIYDIIKVMTTVSELSRTTLKRLRADLKKIRKEPCEFIDAIPDDKNVLIWYFMIIGPSDSQYKGGHYIGKIMHNKDYPQKPPDYMMLTPNGRFLTDKKICITNSGYHSDQWSPAWSITALLQGFISIYLADTDTGISHIKRSKEERQGNALNSIPFNLEKYPSIYEKFEPFIERFHKTHDKDGKKIEIINKEKKPKKVKKNKKKKEENAETEEK